MHAAFPAAIIIPDRKIKLIRNSSDLFIYEARFMQNQNEENITDNPLPICSDAKWNSSGCHA